MFIKFGVWSSLNISPRYTKRLCHNVCTAFWKHSSELWGSREIRIKLSNLPVIVCTQRPHSVPQLSTRRSYSVLIAFSHQSVSTAFKKLRIAEMRAVLSRATLLKRGGNIRIIRRVNSLWFKVLFETMLHKLQLITINCHLENRFWCCVLYRQ